MRNLIGFFIYTLALTACGASSDSPSDSAGSDTISSSSPIRFDVNSSSLRVLTPKSSKSQVLGLDSICAVSLTSDLGENVAYDISYRLIDQNQLAFGPETYTYKRSLPVPRTLDGVDDRIFSVWSIPDRLVEGVSLSFELEIEPANLTLRLSCKS